MKSGIQDQGSTQKRKLEQENFKDLTYSLPGLKERYIEVYEYPLCNEGEVDN